MRRSVPRCSVTAALLILAPATAAHAECAWVLWSLNKTDYQKMQRQPIVEGKGRIPNFVFRANCERLAAFETQAQCMAVLKARAERRSERRSSAEDVPVREDTCWPVGVNPWPDSLERD